MKYFLLLAALFLSQVSLAASCCGGGFAFPALILGDDSTQVTSTYSYGRISDDVRENGKWIKRDDNNLSQTVTLEAATLLSEHFQAGLIIPLIQRQLGREQSAGTGDISLSLGHETFPELSFSKWKPKGLTFLQLTLPTSPSIYDSTSNMAVDSRGRGFYSLGAGLALLKNWIKYDANFHAEVHKSFGRSFSSPSLGGDIEATPGWGGSLMAGIGWNKGDYRLGTSVGMNIEESIKISGAQNSSGAAQRYYPWAVQGSYMLDMESAVTLSYVDQSLLGDPNNTNLSKTMNLSYQKRWPR
ncbi:hypothetical protein D3C87_125730 [compost metagenome]